MDDNEEKIEKMIVYIAGGLGNQMFEYAYVRALQLKYGVGIKYDLCELGYRFYEGRKFGLANLNIAQDAVQINNNWLRYTIFKTYKKLLINKIKNISIEEKYSYFNKHNLIVSLDTYKFYKFDINDKIKFIYGNFQSWKYFKEYEAIIKKELQVKKMASIENQQMIVELSNCNSVCVHIRRGDYINSPKWSSSLDVCTYLYYLKGMGYIQTKCPDAVFYIFSNTPKDLEWIKANYNFSKFNVKYVEMDNPDYEEIRLMYSCKHFVISNSTFSWWGQYLAKSEDKIVIAPSIWNKNEDASDLYQDDWVIIDV